LIEIVATPTAILLDWWLGVEGIAYLRERDVHSLVARAAADGGDIGKLEATGVQNFLDLDDLQYRPLSYPRTLSSQ
jgi:metal transporter CNNM